MADTIALALPFSQTISMPEHSETLEITEYAPVVEMADTMDLGDVTLVKGFVPPLAAMILW